MTVAYGASEVTDVGIDNDSYVCELIETGYAVHQYKVYAEDNKATIRTQIKSTVAPSSSTVYLQIYNISTSTWETIASNSTANADTEFILEAFKTDLTDYKDVQGLISVRIYQQFT